MRHLAPSASIPAAILSFIVGFACAVDDDCSNGTCVCPVGSRCDFECASPPCHVDCSGENPQCDGTCGNGECTCREASTCAFECHSPPCHVSCGPETDCSGTCANGECSCAAGSSCSFDCQSGPCHVTCEGANPRCDGTCANGTCTCGDDSTCEFFCLDADCAATCGESSACTLRCPGGTPGAQGCSFDACPSGEPTVCDAETIVCGTPCPT